MENPESLAKRLSIPCHDLSLLGRALTHRSFVNEHPEVREDNERLEFLGDAVLDFLVGAYLYRNFPEKPEGDLTRMRSALVRTEQLAGFARRLNLGDAMLLGRGEVQAGGRVRDVLLCATFEALVGAIYLQCGLPVVQDFIYPMLENYLADRVLDEETYDPKSRLQEWSQGQRLGIPHYSTISSSGPDHDRTFVVEVEVNGKVLGSGHGSSKQAAARNAARDALKSIK